MAATPVKILLIEDNPADARLLREFLQETTPSAYEVVSASRLSEAMQRLADERFDVILADLSLPDGQGLDTFHRLNARAPDTPILVMSGFDDEAFAATAVRDGAQDYLVKGRMDAYAVSRAIRYSIERHRVEQALQESEALYKRLLESITDYTYTVMIEQGRAARSIHNPGCVAVTGYEAADYEEQPDLWYKMIHEADRAAVVEQAARVSRGEVPPPLEHRILHKNGQVRWVRNTVVPRRDAQGRLLAYDGLIADITERKRAEEKLITSEAFYHSLVENLPQNILRKDVGERFTFANQRFCKLLGRPLEQIIGHTDFDFYPAELAAKYQRDDRYVMSTGETFDTVEENVAPNGETLYVHVIKTPIHDAQGRIIGIQGIFWDITARRRAEEALRKANQDLAKSEAALRKSHEELKSAQLQLIQAEKMESIGTLAAGVAHEVKNPLAILLMGVNYLAKKLPAEDENFRTVLQEMRDAISRADSITHGLLDFSAQRQLALMPESVNALIEETLLLVRHELGQKRVELRKDFAADLPLVAVDKNRLQQVFVNLFVNAIHAMPEGGLLTVRTFARQLTETSHHEGSRKAASFWVGDVAVVAEVLDTGSGIPEENLAKIFDPFFTTKPTGVGTGLGLPVSKKIIELHGGMLEVRNRNEGGVKVTVTLRPQKN